MGAKPATCSFIARALILALVCSACTSATAATGWTTQTLPLAAGWSPATYYVRPDGGSPGECTGLVDAAYSGSGTGQDCAWNHPFRALPPAGPPRIQGADTLIIGPGSYRMGYGAPEADLEDDVCARDYPGDCHMPPIPAGPDAEHPTRILGAGWDAGCPDPPELWGTQRVDLILNLTGAANVELRCLEITDHAGCVEFHTGGLACQRDGFPYGDWASDGLYAEDSANVRLNHLNIHGLASAGIRAGRLADWTVQDVRIAGNGWVGWEGDIEGDDANRGTMHFRRWTVEWNGCGETYPGGEPAGCWAQTAGGYGDGIGTGLTGGDWIIEDSRFLHNTSDGLDLLYHSLGGRVVLDRVHAEGNAGNQVKITGQAVITNSLFVGNCAFFEGQPFTYHVDPCRALGNTLEVVYTGGEQSTIVNSTFYSQGDGLVFAGVREGFACDGSESIRARNSVFLGDQDLFSPGDVTFLFYQEGCGELKLDSDYNIADRVKNLACGINGEYVSSGTHDLCQDPQLVGPLSGETYGLTLSPASPAIDAGDNALCPAVDYAVLHRPMDGDGDGLAICDMGAYEWQPTTAVSYLPLVATAAPPPALLAVNDFVYQLQDLDLEAIGQTVYDLVIIDYSAEGDDETAFSADQIAALKASSGGPKVVLAYMSIGEAEDYRFYWQADWEPGDPAWLDVENPDWEGNYKVRYWDPGWQAIIFDYTSRLLDAGFDGAYLDVVDAYEYYAGRGRVGAAQQMADFVAAIRLYTRARDPAFYVLVQNAPELAILVPSYLNSVDGIGQEDIYYGHEDDDVQTPPEVTSRLERYLDVFRSAGKQVLTVDYAATPAHVHAAYTSSRAHGYVPFVTVRDLDRLIVHAGHEPD